MADVEIAAAQQEQEQEQKQAPAIKPLPLPPEWKALDRDKVWEAMIAVVPHAVNMATRAVPTLVPNEVARQFDAGMAAEMALKTAIAVVLTHEANFPASVVTAQE